MPTVYDVNPTELIMELSKELKSNSEIVKPEWANHVKTGHFKEYPPVNEDWWHVRAASILRKIYVKGPIGVQRLRGEYGGRERRGVKPEHAAFASGKIIRTILQQLEKAGLVKSDKGGRVITPKGRSLLDKVATRIVRATSV